MVLLLSGFVLTSCYNSRKAVYFNNIQDTTLSNTLATTEPVIQPNDLLNIMVTSLNPEASMVFNTPNITMPVTATSSGTTPSSGYGTPQLMGYLVNSDGTITNVNAGLCLDANNAGSANGTSMVLWSCGSGDNQKWTLN